VRPDYFNPDTYAVIDKITGEEVDVSIFIEEVKSGYWEKAYAKTLADYIKIGGTGSATVLAYLLRTKNSDNLVLATRDEMIKGSGASRGTVSKVIKALTEKGFLKLIRSGCYMISPKLIRHGSNTRGAMLLRLWSE